MEGRKERKERKKKNGREGGKKERMERGKTELMDECIKICDLHNLSQFQFMVTLALF